MLTRLLFAALIVLLVAMISAVGQAAPVIAGAEEVTGDGGPDAWTNVLYINEQVPFDFSGTGADHGVLTNIDFWVASPRENSGVFTPFVAEPLVEFPQTGEDFVIRAIGTTREAGTSWQCGGLYRYPFHETESFVVRDGWVVGFLSSDPQGARVDTASPIPFVPDAAEDGWLTGTVGPGSGTPYIELNQPILEGTGGTNVDAYGFRHYQFQVQAEPGDTKPPLPPGGRVDGPCLVRTGDIAGTYPLAAVGVPDGANHILYVNEDAPFDFSEFGTDQGVLKEFNFWVAGGRELEGMVTPFVVEPLVEGGVTGEDFIVRAIGTTREAGVDWEEAGEYSFPFHDTEQFVVQDGWLAGFVHADPAGTSDMARSPIPFEYSNVNGWLTYTGEAGTEAPAIALNQPIVEGLAGTNVDAFGLRRYQFNLVAEPESGAEPGDFNGDGVLDAVDINILSAEVRLGDHKPAYDLNSDGLVNDTDHTVWVEELKYTYLGDANLDGEFTSGDFVDVFVAGKYEDRIDANAGWAEGDWDGNADFDSGDFVAAFVAGGYELGPRPPRAANPVPEPSCYLLVWLAVAGLAPACRRVP